ncbi:hypothetical protein GCK72_009066 [Caenorhabditis remanei]|uniref:BRCT domain-containing protein n=1 Tax=Caenorhabditis remanei TaxID=31234 RepID=A0A6A5H1X6_CAERE|nr:hypothetical protein GCK72_009066 [Caenorhabditis remanei]KAF1760816.1 hypothetical protein GCK72_009066 [Caenorhabditis remanei]
MRCHVIITLLALTTCLGTGNPKSDLEVVYDELATITRITNAITLQAEGLRKNVKVRDVVVELLKTDPTVFSTLLSFNPDKLVSAMTQLMDKIEKLRDKNIDWEKLEDARKWVERLRGSLEDDQESAKSLDTVTGEGEIKLFFDLIYGKQDDVKEYKDQTTTVITNWNKLNDKNDNTAMATWRGEIENTKQLFPKLDKLNTLLQGFPSLSLKFYSISAMLSNAKFYKSSDAAHFTQLREIFGHMSGIWRYPTDTSEKAGEPFDHVVSKLKEMLPNFKRPEVKLTIGFPERKDMTKVADDLNNKWFLQKVARGSSVEELRQELAGFFKFGELVTTCAESWEAFASGFKENEAIAGEMSEVMKDIEAYKGGPNGKQLLDTSLKNYQRLDCGKKLPMNLGAFEDLIKECLVIDSRVKELQGMFNITLEVQWKNKLFEELTQIKDNTTITAEEITDGQRFSTVSTMIVKLKKLETSLTAFMGEQSSFAEKFNHKTSITDETKNGITGFTEFKKCIRNLVNSGLKPQELMEIVGFLKHVKSLVQLSSTSTVSNVLQKFGQMRKDVFKAESFVKNIKSNYDKTKNISDSPVLKLKNPEETLLSLGRGMYVLRDMAKALKMKDDLIASKKFPDYLNVRILKKLQSWKERKNMVDNLIEELDSLNKFSAGVKDESLLTMRKILDEAAKKVHGFPEMYSKIVDFIPTNSNITVEMKIVEKLAEIDMDFASHKGYLQAASLSFEELRKYYDEIFGLEEKQMKEESNYMLPIFICITIFILIFIGLVLIFGLTKTGRKFFKNRYLYYFAKPKDFEKRWRYSFFMDRQDQKNSLVDAVHEINTTNVLKAVKNGAYINVYNPNGNTPLHVATKRAFPEIVEILIKNGADRTYLNAKNKTPEQMIPPDWRTSQTTQTAENPERFGEVEKIYKKYRNKKFRLRVPQEFPSSSFHIYINENVDDEQAEKFIKKFQAITTHEALPTTTHCIVKTDSNGILEIDTMDMVCWINSGVIMVKESWMTDCLDNEKLIERDCDYLVEKVKYKDVVYDTVIPWAQAMAKGEMPYLHGVLICVLIQDYPSLVALTTMVAAHGGILCMSDKIPDKFLKVGAHPYLHAHLGPIFVLYDQTSDVAKYRNDPNKMYTLFTEEEFAAFMLKRGINVDTRPEPISIVTEMED